MFFWGPGMLSLIPHRKPSPALDTGYGPTRWLPGAGEQSLCGSIGGGGMYPVGVRSINPPHGVCVKRDPRLHQRVLHSLPFPGDRIALFLRRLRQGGHPVGVRSVNSSHGICVKRDPRLHQRVLHSLPFPGDRIAFFCEDSGGEYQVSRRGGAIHVSSVSS